MSKYNYDHDVPFEAYITNLGKYNEGELVGEWVKFPVDEEELEAVFKRIGIGSTDEFGQPYEEIFITDYDVYVEGLYSILGEYENLETLNELAEKFEDMEDYEYEKFTAVLEAESVSDIDDVMRLIDDLDNWVYLAGIENDSDLGYYWVNEFVDTSNLGELAGFIDYERYGESLASCQGGTFTNNGYVYR